MTPRQTAMVEFIRTYISANGYAPSYQNMVDAGVASSSSVAHYNLVQLREQGVVTFTDGLARTIRLTEAAE